MALLGYQLAITLVMASVIQKIGKHYSFARWLLCSTGLTRYLFPTDDELRTLAGVPKEKKGKKERKNGENGDSSQIFHVPRNLDIELECARINILDVIYLRYFEDYKMLIDFSVHSLAVYVLTEIISYFLPLRNEINLSMVWCLLVVLYSTKILLSLTLQYFTGEESIGERSTVIVTFFAYLLIAMAILLVDESNLETGLELAYTSFNSSANSFLERHGLESEGPASKLILKFSIALWCALIGALFTFPGLRLAKMHWDSIRYCKDKKSLGILLNLNFAAPFFVVLLWLRPISKHYMTVRVFSGMEKPIMSENAFDSLRLVLIVVVVSFRFALMPLYLQSYLNMAYLKFQEQKKEAGRITNKELQRNISGVFYYVCVVALQYLTPVLMCLFFALMYKTLGEFSWKDIFEFDNPPIAVVEDECPAESGPSLSMPLAEEDSVLRSAQEITLAISSLKQVLTKEVARGLFGFATWWICFAWFASSSLGLLYQSYFTSY